MADIDTDSVINGTKAVVAESARLHFAATVTDYSEQLAAKSLQCAQLEQVPGQPTDIIERNVRQAARQLAGIYGAPPRKTPWLIVLIEFIFVSAASFLAGFLDHNWGIAGCIACTVIAGVLLVVHYTGENGSNA